jgi:RNA polymerase sigma-70 factor (ECF subfamily)
MAFTDDDEALVAAALNGSSFAWETLVKRHETRIYNYGLRLTGNPTDAMDLMQEVFLGIYRNLHRFRGDARFTTWLFRIAHNKAIDMNRRKSLFAGQVDLDGDEALQIPDAGAGVEPEFELIRAQNNDGIQALLRILPMEQRIIVELKIFQSQTFEEIAAMQDISENTAKTRFYTALRKLKNALEKDHVLS